MLLCPGCKNKKERLQKKHLTPISARFSAALVGMEDVEGGRVEGGEWKDEGKQGCRLPARMIKN